MKKENGFTLIELLVVIAIIALLMAIILPAMGIAKEMAKSLVCQTNVKGLAAAWQTYVSENDNKVPSSITHNPKLGTVRDCEFSWAWSPWNAASNNAVVSSTSPTSVSLEEQQEGIKRGALWPYMESIDSYHCPSDRSEMYADNGERKFRTYSMPDSFEGTTYQESKPSDTPHNNISKSTQIRNPGGKYIFLSENDKRAYNIDGFVLSTIATSWNDPMALWHRKHNNFSFADGHSEQWKWSQETQKLLKEGYAGVSTNSHNERDDLERVRRAFPGLK